MSFTMPDLRNLSETTARTALRALGLEDTLGVTLYPPVGATWDDAASLGTEYLYGKVADTVGADGTISWQSPVPGATVNEAVPDHLIWTDPTTGVSRSDPFQFDVWGSPLTDDGLETTLVAWTQSPETSAYSEGHTTGPWADADWAAGSSFRVEITSLHRPSTPAQLLTVAYDADDPMHRQYAAAVEGGVFNHVSQFSDISVKETLNDQTELQFTMSMHDPLVVHVVKADLTGLPAPEVYAYTVPAGYEPNGAYAFAVRVYYRNQTQPCFWAPCTYSKDFGDTSAGRPPTVTITGVDVIRLQHHFLRFGDDALNVVGDDGLQDTGLVTLDYEGIRDVLQAAHNIPAQDTRDVPTLALAETYMAGTVRTAKLGVERSQAVWDVIQQITGHQLGPDWWLEPRDDTAGAYARVRTFDKRGSDRTATVRWMYGVTDTTDNPGLVDNVSAVTATPLLPVTHAHVVASDQTEIRETSADALESYMRGIYVDWTAQDGNTRGKDETLVRDGLHALAAAKVDAYANAPEAVEITLRPDAAQDTFWREQFWPGDTAYHHAVKGYVESEGNLRILAVEVGEQGSRGPTTTKVTVVPDKTSDAAGEES